VVHIAVRDKPILLDLCAGTGSVGDSIDRDLWDYVALDIDYFSAKRQTFNVISVHQTVVADCLCDDP